MADFKKCRDDPSAGRVLRSMIFAVAGLLVVLVIVFIASAAFHMHPLTILYGSERWAGLVANLIVLFYAFPAFKRTRHRGFLFLAIAALIFMYSILFGLIFPARAMSLGQRELFYGVKYLVYIAGLGLYARGVMLLAKNGGAKLKDSV